ncbi:type II toxin-antitoxin system HicA family toxin [Paenibacillus thiaminolyticus]|uniref:type II toxin-antitoxin system HicA family toxin n=2 Tax=Paenibacillus thiaminolyticus TaxID=49283 RepID=UPI0019815218|nr:type II toxin-antitoxin system HicA family toxin [Paenibacillus thiaminolyticus]
MLPISCEYFSKTTLNRWQECFIPSWSDLENFLRRDGWVMVRQNGRDKIYEKTLPNGEVLRTAVSKGTGEIGKGLFNRILKHQLRVDKEYFNSKK